LSVFVEKNLFYDLWNASPVNGMPPITSSFMGNRFFITSSSITGLSRGSKGNGNSFVLTAKVAVVQRALKMFDITVFVVMHGMLVTRFFSYYDAYLNANVPCALVNWFVLDGDEPDEAIGM
jgi:hypothetical protein